MLDTNVVISALNFHGNERLVLELDLRGRFELALSWFTLGEVSGVLARKFGWHQARAIRAISALQAAAAIVELPRLAEVIADARADYLVTGGRRNLLPLGEHWVCSIFGALRFLSALNG